MADERQLETIREPLSEDDIRKRGLALAREIQSRVDLKTKKDAAAAAFAAEIKAIDERVATLTAQITSGVEERQVEVIMIPDAAANVKKFIRVDLNTEIRREPMTWSERQEWLGFGDINGPSEPDTG